jgi:hypothetical protein
VPRPHVLVTLVASVILAVSCTATEERDRAEPAEPDPDPSDEVTEADDEHEDEVPPEEEPSELELRLREIADQVSVLRDLPVLDEIATEVVEPEDFAEILTELGAEADALERTVAAERVLIALRHLPEDADLSGIQDELLTSAVVGLYDPAEATAYISSEAEPLGPAAASTAAHELLHALQDQHFDLTRLEDIPEDDGDALLAFHSVVEGDAVILEDQWASVHQTDEERAEAEREQLASAGDQLRLLQDAPPYVVESLVFPYIAGERFVATLINEGGYEAVDAALEEPPRTTLEILDPDQYLSGEFEPVEVTAGSAPGEDWQPLFRSTFGAFDLLALFGASTAPGATQGSTAWPAWRGGALEAWQRDEETTVAAAWVFEDADRADTACQAVAAWYEDVAEGETDGDVWRGDRDVLGLDCTDETVRFSLAPDAATATATLETD